MCTDDTNDVSTNGAGEPADDTPQPVAESQAKPGWNRRTFLKAAALGTAAAALINRVGDGGLSFGPLSDLADDLSSLNCTANDVRIVGPGLVLNEPCNCTSPFTAQVQFHI